MVALAFSSEKGIEDGLVCLEAQEVCPTALHVAPDSWRLAPPASFWYSALCFSLTLVISGWWVSYHEP